VVQPLAAASCSPRIAEGSFSIRCRRSSRITSRSGRRARRRGAGSPSGPPPSHDQGQAVLRDHLEVGGEVVAGDGVVVAAVPGHDLRELAGGHLLRALEHQVLEEVRQAGLRLRAVGGADPVPEPVRHDRGPAVRHHDDLQPVVEREGLRVEQRRGDLEGPALVQARRGTGHHQRRSRQARLLTAPGAGCSRCER
jgi:hypothetical protein